MIGISVSSAQTYLPSSFVGRHAVAPISLNSLKTEPESDQKVSAVSAVTSQRVQAKQQGGLLEGSNLIQAQESEQKSETAGKPGELTQAEEKLVKELKSRDAEVRRHEEAHARAGGAYAGTPSYQFQRGPDGGQYAIGGSTSIDVSPIAGDPEATIRKMETIKRAASAPADPSGADRSVTAQANSQAQAARAELARERQGEQQAVYEQPVDQDRGDEPGSVVSGGMLDFARSSNAYRAVAALHTA